MGDGGLSFSLLHVRSSHAGRACLGSPTGMIFAKIPWCPSELGVNLLHAW